jgi:preprotein translocase subunit SecE
MYNQFLGELFRIRKLVWPRRANIIEYLLWIV